MSASDDWDDLSDREKEDAITDFIDDTLAENGGGGVEVSFEDLPEDENGNQIEGQTDSRSGDITMDRGTVHGESYRENCLAAAHEAGHSLDVQNGITPPASATQEQLDLLEARAEAFARDYCREYFTKDKQLGGGGGGGGAESPAGSDPELFGPAGDFNTGDGDSAYA